MTVPEDFLRSAKRQFLYYKTIGEKAMEQLESEQLFVSVNENTNSIATIIKHLHGNMLSRWTNFLTSDGEKEWRNRDGEFDDTIDHAHLKKDDILKLWNEGWECLFAALDQIGVNDLDKTIYIRNEGHSVLEAINRQMAHYPYHVGQIVFYAKMLKQTTWTSLSIPKHKSGEYNTIKFSKEKEKKHYTDDEMDNLK